MFRRLGIPLTVIFSLVALEPAHYNGLALCRDYHDIDKCFPNFFARIPICLRKITTDPHILVHVNTECPYDRYPKLKMCISELILGSFKYIPLALVTMQCMIGPCSLI